MCPNKDMLDPIFESISPYWCTKRFKTSLDVMKINKLHFFYYWSTVKTEENLKFWNLRTNIYRYIEVALIRFSCIKSIWKEKNKWSRFFRNLIVILGLLIWKQPKSDFNFRLVGLEIGYLRISVILAVLIL